MVSGGQPREIAPRQKPTGFYVADDQAMIAKFLNDDWNVPEVVLKKPLFQSNPDEDMDTFDYSTGEIQCVIKADEIKRTPKGVGFDGYEQTREIHLTISALRMDVVLQASDIIDDILAHHAIRPAKPWDLLYNTSDEPVYPFRKFYRRTITYELKTFWRPRLNNPRTY